MSSCTQPSAELVRQIVRYNQVLVGSLNSNRSHFEMAVRDMAVGIRECLDGVFDKMIGRRFPPEEYQKAFDVTDLRLIKTIMEFSP